MQKEGKEIHVLRSETKVSWGIVTVLLCLLSAIISRETVGADIQRTKDSIAVLERGLAVAEQKIEEMREMKADVKEIKELLLQHIGEGTKNK